MVTVSWRTGWTNAIGGEQGKVVVTFVGEPLFAAMATLPFVRQH